VATLHVEGRNFAALWFVLGFAYFFLYREYNENRNFREAVEKVQKIVF